MSSARPRDWHPLSTEDRHTDPTPGSPADIRTGRRSMTDTAVEIRAQINRLRALSDGTGLKGDYADALQDGADRLRDKLTKVAERYEAVAVKVSAWADAVEDAQHQTVEAHRAATSAHDVITRLEALPEADLTPTQKSDLDHARASLVRAQAAFDGTVGDYESDARRLSGAIEDLLDDSLEDSCWSWTSNLLERNAAWINEALEIIGWIATAVAIAAVLIACAPTAPAWLALAATWALAGAEAATYGTAVIHTALATTGNGTWADVGLDVIAILTLRMGKAAEQGVSAGVDATRVASRQAAKDAVAEARAAQGEARQKIASELRNRSIPKPRRQFLEGQLKQMNKEARAVARYPSQHVPEVSNSEIWRAGGSRSTAVAEKMGAHEAAKHSENSTVQAAAHQLNRSAVKNSAAFTVGTVADLADKGAGSSDVFEGKPSLAPYNDAKDSFRFQSSWLDPDVAPPVTAGASN
ncbi:hypothetical protein QMK19_23435 [Streptomyces sp. H10-C2]|uniref:hypothetical protein n=1 Tax=unclassified Streptomyces TaxID=2593676 RepID=UPI0024BA1F37|nr:MULTISPECIES: hypothetical protein [unclassified Streptomyces]MDJ0342753.1 hypothetical protein [Streptomyces sp. PH10-H1]MDJ0372537.1 hypothetical protein [Streptomyces sp. H10-C2]